MHNARAAPRGILTAETLRDPAGEILRAFPSDGKDRVQPLVTAGIIRCSLNHSFSVMCHLLQYSWMFLEKYGRMKFSASSIPNMCDTPQAISI